MAMIPVFLYLITLYVRPQDWVPGMVGLPTAFIILPLGFAIGLANRLREPEKMQVPQTWLMFGYLVVIFMATLVNIGFSGALTQLDIFGKRVVVFYMIAWLLITPARVETTIWAVMTLSAFLAYQAYLQGTTGESWGGMTPYPGYDVIRVRWYGDWDGPNVYGLLFVIASGFALEYVFGPHSIGIRMLAAAFGVSYVVAIFFTNSRGAVLALACMALFYFRSRFRSAFAIALALTVVLALMVLGPSRMSEVSSKESSARERTWLWEQGLTLLKKNPVFGVGRGEFSRNVDLNLIAHNNFVQNFAECGLLGFFFFVSLLWFSFKGAQILSDKRHAASPQLAAHGRMISSVLVGYVATTFFVVMELDLLYFVLGLSAAVYLAARRENPLLPKLEYTKKDLMMVGAGMAGVLVMIWLAAVKHIL